MPQFLRRAPRRLALGAAGLVLGLALAGCGQEAACDNETVREMAIAAVRKQYPNDVSKELLRRGSVPALDRILRERKLDQKDEKQLEIAARAAVKEMEDSWTSGRFTLENVEPVDFDAKANRASCRARMVFMTSWGISVRDITFDATLKDGKLDVTTGGLN